jgi:putative cytoplasmic protein
MLQENEIYSEIVEACNIFSISNSTTQNGEEILKEITSRYTTGNPRVWWLSFKNIPQSYHFANNYGFRHIEDILIQNNVVPPKTVYFIADIDDESEDNPVFKISLDKVPNVLEECRFF